MKNQQKILEIGFEGGSIKIFKVLDEKNKEWFYYKLSDMGSEEIDGVEYENKYSMSFPEVIYKMLIDYRYALSNHPLFIDNNYSNVMIEFLKDYQKKENIDKLQWSKILNINPSDLE